jgi:hypothetical protein
MTRDIELQLKELILDEDFTSLQNLVNEEVNLMDILRVSHKELQHSNFLAWLFNPSETHNLSDSALKDFIKIYFRENQFQDLGNYTGLSVFDFVKLDFDDLEIRREYKNIDLIFLSKKNQFCLVIENKIYAKESNGQLNKYRSIIETEYADYKHKIYIFLSLFDQEISEIEQDFYVQLNYGHIIKLIEQIIANQRTKLADKTKFVLEQYLQTLKSMLNQNEEIKIVAQQLYKKYKSAFDLVLKYAVPTYGSEILNKLKELIQNERSIRPFQSDNTYVRFQPNFLYDNIERLKKNGLSSNDLINNWVFLYEFNVRKDKVNFDLKIGSAEIGSGTQEAREKLYEIYRRNKNIYNKADRTFRSQWHLSFQKQILSAKDIQDFLENDRIEELEKKLTEKFRELIDNDLPKLMDVLDKEMI